MSRQKRIWILAAALLVVIALIPNWIGAQQQRGPQQQRPGGEPEALRAAPPLARLFSLDSYTEYGMLDPSTNSFRIVFMPLETRPGATILINGTRHGSEGGGVEVYDPRTGKPLKFEYLSGEEMTAKKIPGNFTPEDHYIKAELPWPVPEGGEGRVLIYKTYKDARTYYTEGNDIVWVRSLGSQRFAVILPKGYSFISANIASQVMTLPDGRLKLSMTSQSGSGLPLTVRARKTSAAFAGNKTYDRAWDDIKTLYDLGEPETHSFKVEQAYSDYRKGEKAKLDIFSYAALQDLKVVDLDTARPLKTMKDGNATVAQLEVPIVDAKQSAHLRVTGRVQDPNYKVENGDLVFERTLHGLRNTVLLPAGWDAAGVSQPSTLGTYQGRAFVALVNNQLEDALKVTIRARKRAQGPTQ